MLITMSPLVVAENTEPQETRKLFEHHYSHIYFVFFDTLCSIEGGIRIKGDLTQLLTILLLTPSPSDFVITAPKQAKEELDSVLLIFEVCVHTSTRSIS